MLAKTIRKPDVSRYVERNESEEEYLHRLFFSARPLIAGALAIAETVREENEDLNVAVSALSAVHGLLSAFNAVMERGSEAVDAAQRKDLPMITVDEFKKLLGDVGGAEVEIKVGRAGILLFNERYHVGKKYHLVRENGIAGLVEVKDGKGGKAKKAA